MSTICNNFAFIHHCTWNQCVCTYRENVCVSKIHMLKPCPSVVVLGGGAFRRYLGHEVESSGVGSVPLQEGRGTSYLFFCYVRTQQEDHHLQTRTRALPKNHTMLDPGLPATRTARNKCLSPSVYHNLL